jgi:hypothetical protein
MDSKSDLGGYFYCFYHRSTQSKDHEEISVVYVFHPYAAMIVARLFDQEFRFHGVPHTIYDTLYLSNFLEETFHIRHSFENETSVAFE